MGAGAAHAGSSQLPRGLQSTGTQTGKEKELQVGPEAELRVTFENILLVESLPCSSRALAALRAHLEHSWLHPASTGITCWKNRKRLFPSAPIFHRRNEGYGTSGCRQRVICARLRDVLSPGSMNDPSLDAFQAQPAVPRHI